MKENREQLNKQEIQKEFITPADFRPALINLERLLPCLNEALVDFSPAAKPLEITDIVILSPEELKLVEQSFWKEHPRLQQVINNFFLEHQKEIPHLSMASKAEGFCFTMMMPADRKIYLNGSVPMITKGLNKADLLMGSHALLPLAHEAMHFICQDKVYEEEEALKYARQQPFQILSTCDQSKSLNNAEKQELKERLKSEIQNLGDKVRCEGALIMLQDGESDIGSRGYNFNEALVDSLGKKIQDDTIKNLSVYLKKYGSPHRIKEGLAKWRDTARRGSSLPTVGRIMGREEAKNELYKLGLVETEEQKARYLDGSIFGLFLEKYGPEAMYWD